MKRSETAQALLDAAERLLGSDDVDPFDAISFRRIGREASYSEATVRKHFSTREEFSRRLVSHLLDKVRRDTSWQGLSRLSDRVADRSERLADIVLDFTDVTIRTAAGSPRLNAQFRLWNWLDNLPDLRAQIEAAAIRRDQQMESFLNKFLSDHADIVRRRSSWISSRDLALVMGALVDGLAVRARTTDEDPLPAETVAKVFGALLAAAIETDVCPHGPLGTLGYVDEMRQSTPVSTPVEEVSLW